MSGGGGFRDRGFGIRGHRYRGAPGHGPGRGGSQSGRSGGLDSRSGRGGNSNYNSGRCGELGPYSGRSDRQDCNAGRSDCSRSRSDNVSGSDSGSRGRSGSGSRSGGGNIDTGYRSGITNRGHSRGPHPNFNLPRRPPRHPSNRPPDNWAPRGAGNSPRFQPWRGGQLGGRFNGPPRPFFHGRGQQNFHPPFRYPNAGRGFPPIGNFGPPIEQKPATPHLGSEEERVQKITEAADALKRKLSAGPKELDNWYNDTEDDAGLDFSQDVDDEPRTLNRGIPELKHDPPELNLTLNDLRDIGRVDHDHFSKIGKTGDRQNEEQDFEVMYQHSDQSPLDIADWTEDNFNDNLEYGQLIGENQSEHANPTGNQDKDETVECPQVQNAISDASESINQDSLHSTTVESNVQSMDPDETAVTDDKELKDESDKMEVLSETLNDTTVKTSNFTNEMEKEDIPENLEVPKKTAAGEETNHTVDEVIDEIRNSDEDMVPYIRTEETADNRDDKPKANFDEETCGETTTELQIEKCTESESIPEKDVPETIASATQDKLTEKTTKEIDSTLDNKEATDVDVKTNNVARDQDTQDIQRRNDNKTEIESNTESENRESAEIHDETVNVNENDESKGSSQVPTTNKENSNEEKSISQKAMETVSHDEKIGEETVVKSKAEVSAEVSVTIKSGKNDKTMDESRSKINVKRIDEKVTESIKDMQSKGKNDGEVLQPKEKMESKSRGNVKSEEGEGNKILKTVKTMLNETANEKSERLCKDKDFTKAQQIGTATAGQQLVITEEVMRYVREAIVHGTLPEKTNNAREEEEKRSKRKEVAKKKSDKSEISDSKKPKTEARGKTESRGKRVEIKDTKIRSRDDGKSRSRSSKSDKKTEHNSSVTQKESLTDQKVKERRKLNRTTILTSTASSRHKSSSTNSSVDSSKDSGSVEVDSKESRSAKASTTKLSSVVVYDSKGTLQTSSSTSKPLAKNSSTSTSTSSSSSSPSSSVIKQKQDSLTTLSVPAEIKQKQDSPAILSVPAEFDPKQPPPNVAHASQEPELPLPLPPAFDPRLSSLERSSLLPTGLNNNCSSSSISNTQDFNAGMTQGYPPRPITTFVQNVPPINFAPPPPLIGTVDPSANIPPMCIPDPFVPLLPMTPLTVRPPLALPSKAPLLLQHPPTVQLSLPPPPPPPAQTSLNMQDELEDMHEAMEFAKQLMNMGDKCEHEDLADSEDSDFFHMPTFPDLPPVEQTSENVAEKVPPVARQSLIANKETCKKGSKSGKSDLITYGPQPMPDKYQETIKMELGTAEDEQRLQDEPIRPKVVFNLNTKTKMISKDEWQHQLSKDEDCSHAAIPTVPTTAPSSETGKHLKNKTSSLVPAVAVVAPTTKEKIRIANGHEDRKKSRFASEKNEERDTKKTNYNGKIEQSGVNLAAHNSLNKKRDDDPTRHSQSPSESPSRPEKRSVTVDLERSEASSKRTSRESISKKSTDLAATTTITTPESTWKSRVIGRFLKMSKNDICNMLNNTGLRKFDIAMKHLVKERRSSLSLEMRNNEEEKMKGAEASYDREEFMDQLNAMLDPSATVDICNLPTQFIHHLSEVLQLESMPELEAALSQSTEPMEAPSSTRPPPSSNLPRPLPPPPRQTPRAPRESTNAKEIDDRRLTKKEREKKSISASSTVDDVNATATVTTTTTNTAVTASTTTTTTTSTTRASPSNQVPRLSLKAPQEIISSKCVINAECVNEEIQEQHSSHVAPGPRTRLRRRLRPASTIRKASPFVKNGAMNQNLQSSLNMADLDDIFSAGIAKAKKLVAASPPKRIDRRIGFNVSSSMESNEQLNRNEGNVVVTAATMKDPNVDRVERAAVELDKIFTAGIARAKLASMKAAAAAAKAAEANDGDDDDDDPGWNHERRSSLDTTGFRQRSNSRFVSRSDKWSRRIAREDPDAFRNLTKEEWEAKYGECSYTSYEKEYRAMAALRARRFEHAPSASPERRVIANQPMTAEHPFSYEAWSDSDGNVNFRNIPEMSVYQRTRSDSETSSTSTSTTTDSSDSAEITPSVTKLLKVIKAREKIAKKKSVNEEIRDEVAAEIEKKRRERGKVRKQHKSRAKKSSHRRRREKKEKLRERKRRDRRRRKRKSRRSDARESSDNDDADEEYTSSTSRSRRSRLLTEEEIKKEVKSEPELPIEPLVPTRRATKRMISKKAIASQSYSASPSSTPTAVASAISSGKLPTVVHHRKTKAQLKQMPEAIENIATVGKVSEAAETAISQRIESCENRGNEITISDSPQSTNSSATPLTQVEIQSASSTTSGAVVVKPANEPIAETLATTAPLKSIAQTITSPIAQTIASPTAQTSTSPVAQTVVSPAIQTITSSVAETTEISTAASVPTNTSSNIATTPATIDDASLSSKSTSKKLDIKAYKERTLKRQLQENEKLKVLAENPTAMTQDLLNIPLLRKKVVDTPVQVAESSNEQSNISLTKQIESSSTMVVTDKATTSDSSVIQPTVVKVIVQRMKTRKKSATVTVPMDKSAVTQPSVEVAGKFAHIKSEGLKELKLREKLKKGRTRTSVERLDSAKPLVKHGRVKKRKSVSTVIPDVDVASVASTKTSIDKVERQNYFGNFTKGLISDALPDTVSQEGLVATGNKPKTDKILTRMDETVRTINEDNIEKNEKVTSIITEAVQKNEETFPVANEVLPKNEEINSVVEKNDQVTPIDHKNEEAHPIIDEVVHTEAVLNSEDAIPNLDEDIPNFEEPTPNIEKDIPNIEEDIPNIDEDIPNIDESLPVNDAVPNSNEGIPKDNEIISKIDQVLVSEPRLDSLPMTVLPAWSLEASMTSKIAEDSIDISENEPFEEFPHEPIIRRDRVLTEAEVNDSEDLDALVTEPLAFEADPDPSISGEVDLDDLGNPDVPLEEPISYDDNEFVHNTTGIETSLPDPLGHSIFSVTTEITDEVITNSLETEDAIGKSTEESFFVEPQESIDCIPPVSPVLDDPLISTTFLTEDDERGASVPSPLLVTESVPSQPIESSSVPDLSSEDIAENKLETKNVIGPDDTALAEADTSHAPVDKEPETTTVRLDSSILELTTEATGEGTEHTEELGNELVAASNSNRSPDVEMEGIATDDVVQTTLQSEILPDNVVDKEAILEKQNENHQRQSNNIPEDSNKHIANEKLPNAPEETRDEEVKSKHSQHHVSHVISKKDHGHSKNKRKAGRHHNHGSKSEKKSALTEKMVDEAIAANVVKLVTKPPRSKDSVMARMIEIDVEIHKLMNEKMTLYRMLESGELTAKETDEDNANVKSSDELIKIPSENERTPDSPEIKPPKNLASRLARNLDKTVLISPSKPQEDIPKKVDTKKINSETEGKIKKRKKSPLRDSKHHAKDDNRKEGRRERKSSESRNNVASTRNDDASRHESSSVHSREKSTSSNELDDIEDKHRKHSRKSVTTDSPNRHGLRTPHEYSSKEDVRESSSEKAEQSGIKGTKHDVHRVPENSPKHEKSKKKKIKIDLKKVEEPQKIHKEGDEEKQTNAILSKVDVMKKTLGSKSRIIYSDESTWDSIDVEAIQNDEQRMKKDPGSTTGLALLEESLKRQAAKKKNKRAMERRKERKKEARRLLLSVNTITTDEEDIPLNELYEQKMDQKREILAAVGVRQRAINSSLTQHESQRVWDHVTRVIDAVAEGRLEDLEDSAEEENTVPEIETPAATDTVLEKSVPETRPEETISATPKEITTTETIETVQATEAKESDERESIETLNLKDSAVSKLVEDAKEKATKEVREIIAAWDDADTQHSEETDQVSSDKVAEEIEETAITAIGKNSDVIEANVGESDVNDKDITESGSVVDETTNPLTEKCNEDNNVSEDSGEKSSADKSELESGDAVDQRKDIEVRQATQASRSPSPEFPIPEMKSVDQKIERVAEQKSEETPIVMELKESNTEEKTVDSDVVSVSPSKNTQSNEVLKRRRRNGHSRRRRRHSHRDTQNTSKEDKSNAVDKRSSSKDKDNNGQEKITDGSKETSKRRQHDKSTQPSRRSIRYSEESGSKRSRGRKRENDAPNSRGVSPFDSEPPRKRGHNSRRSSSPNIESSLIGESNLRRRGMKRPRQDEISREEMMSCKVLLIDCKHTYLSPNLNSRMLRKLGISRVNPYVAPIVVSEKSPSPVPDTIESPPSFTETLPPALIKIGDVSEESLVENPSSLVNNIDRSDGDDDEDEEGDEDHLEGTIEIVKVVDPPTANLIISDQEEEHEEEEEEEEDAIQEINQDTTDLEEEIRSPVEMIPAQERSSDIEIEGDNSDISNCIEVIEERVTTTTTQSSTDKIQTPEIEIEKDTTVESRTRYTVHKGPILDIKVLDDSFLAASEDGIIYRYSQISNGILNIYKGHEAAVTCLYVLEMPGKHWNLYSGSLDGTFRCYDIMTGLQERPAAPVGSPVQCMDQAWGVIFVGTKSGHISRYNIKSANIRGDRLEFSDKSVLALKASAEGPRRVLIVASRNQPITIRDAQTGLFLRTICGYKNHTVYSLMRERNLVYCGTSSTSIPVFDFTNGEQVTQYNAGVGIVCMRLYCQLLFAGCYDGNIYVFDTKEPKLICSIPGPGNMLLSMEVVGDEIIAGSKDRRLHAWRMPKQVRELVLERT